MWSTSIKDFMMQTLTISVQDSFVQDFLQIIEQYKDKIQLQKDKNLEYDPYFYERQKELQQIRDDIKSGKTKMIDNETFWNDIEKHIETL
jgi:nicotinamide mononucleotide adenylyltransferase